jgi:hypothetical protein
MNSNTTIAGNLTVTGLISGSHTITHKTNIIDFTADQIGCFCETTGEIPDVYSHPVGLDFPCDAICKVKHSSILAL